MIVLCEILSCHNRNGDVLKLCDRAQVLRPRYHQDNTPGRRLAFKARAGRTIAIKKSWRALTKVWLPHDVPELVVDFSRCWSEKTEISTGRLIH